MVTFFIFTIFAFSPYSFVSPHFLQMTFFRHMQIVKWPEEVKFAFSMYYIISCRIVTTYYFKIFRLWTFIFLVKFQYWPILDQILSLRYFKFPNAEIKQERSWFYKNHNNGTVTLKLKFPKLSKFSFNFVFVLHSYNIIGISQETLYLHW